MQMCIRDRSIAIDYEIREVRNSAAATLIYTNPKMLNLQEMYGVAKNFRPGTKEYRDCLLYTSSAEKG